MYPDDFLADVASGQLPAVSWVIPPAGYDEHPSSPPALGEWFTSQLVAALTSNPEVWSKTVLFHMYDENDGFFDHVPPPVPSAGTAGEYLTAAHPARRRQGHPRAGRHGLPGADAGGLAVQPGRPRRVRASSTTPRSCASWRSASACGHPTSRPGAGAPRATSPRRCISGAATRRSPRCRARRTTRWRTSSPWGAPSWRSSTCQTDMPVYPVPLRQSMPRQETV